MGLHLARLDRGKRAVRGQAAPKALSVASARASMVHLRNPHHGRLVLLQSRATLTLLPRPQQRTACGLVHCGSWKAPRCAYPHVIRAQNQRQFISDENSDHACTPRRRGSRIRLDRARRRRTSAPREARTRNNRHCTEFRRKSNQLTAAVSNAGRRRARHRGLRDWGHRAMRGPGRGGF